MEIETLARKLKPLMPDKVERWLRARDSGDPKLTTLIDQEILYHAYRELGDFRNKILLSLPNKSIAQGPIHLGRVLYETPKWPAGISPSELLQHLAIFGRSGSGKTNLAFHLLRQIAEQNIPFLFLDFKRTARHLIPHLKDKVQVYTPGRSLSPLAFNPFMVPPGLESDIYVNQLIDVLAESFTLGDGSKSLLQTAIAACYAQGKGSATVPEILAKLQALPDTGRVKGWKVSAVRALESLAFAGIGTTRSENQPQIVQNLLTGGTLLEDLDALDQNTKQFLSLLLCLWIYYVKLTTNRREQLELVIFIEEAHHLLYKHENRSKESIMNMFLRQVREIGIGVVVIDQHIHLISSAVVGNCYTTLCLNQKDPTDINKAAGLCLLDETEKKYLSMLQIGQGIVKLQDRWRQPFLVAFPLVNLKKGHMTDDALKKYLNQSGNKPHRVQQRIHDKPVDIIEAALDEEDLNFLEDVLLHRSDGVKARYRRLGWSMDKGNRIKNKLVEHRWLDCEAVRVGLTRKMVLRFTSEARKILGITENSTRYESMAHEYWKHTYARFYRDQGYQVQIEAPRRHGRTDLLARNHREQIAIEIETGKSNIVENVKQNLASGFDQVVVVPTDKQAFEKVERQLARAGLLIPGRVAVVSEKEAWNANEK